MVKFRVTETSNGTFENAEGSLPFDIEGLGPGGATVRVQVWNTSTGAAVVVPPYNNIPPEIVGTPDIAQVLALGGDSWSGAVGFNYWWYADGVQVATTATFTVTSAERGKTITAAKQAQGVGGSDPSAIVAATNSLFIPSSSGDGVLVAGEYILQEAVADADTRKTYVEIYDEPPTGFQWVVYRGTDPAGVISTVAVPTFTVDKYIWTSTGTAAVGTGPTGRTVVYVRIGLREVAVPSNAYFVTPAGENFLASSIPGAPTVSLATGAGQGEIYITLDAEADGAGRAITGYQYSLDGGAWETLPGGIAYGQRTINTGVPTTTYSVRVRATNANGDGAATAAANVTSGTSSVVPSAFGAADWSLTDKPSTLGNKVTLGFTTLPSNGGSAITDVQYQINAGSWVSIGATPTSLDVTVPATTLVDMQIRAVNSVGNGATDTKSITPTAIAAASTTAYFGADTFANAGSWRPETTLGDEVTLTGIVPGSDAAMTRTWAITGGALVCTTGTPAVDNAKTLTVTTTAGNITVTISTVANAWSVADATELRAALSATNASPATVYLRPRLYDLGRGSGSATPTGLGVFHLRTYTATNRRTVDKHPSQVKKPWSVDTGSNTRTTQYLTIKNFRFTVASTDFGKNNAVLSCDNANGGGVVKFYIDNCDFEAPTIPIDVLTDPTPWPAGYTGVTFTPLKLMGTTGAFRGTQITNCTFRNVWHAGDYTVREDFKFNNNVIDTYYFDGIRLFPETSLWTGSPDTMAKEITGNTIIGSFGGQNELVDTPNAPHCDAQQIISGSLSDC
ncbi:MAG: fibronectin type III domain-containing protein, partial [Planctomycetaceae bacterium]